MVTVRPAVSLVPAVAKNAALALPGVRRERERQLLAHGLGAEASRRHVEGIFRRHGGAAAAVRPIEHADVLEVGPGGNLSVLELFRASGARRTTAIDVVPWVAAGSNDEDRAVEYLCPVTVEELPFPNESFDIVYSHACFQYVADPESAVGEIARVLRVGGVTTHIIDLGDPSRRGSSDPLRFLRYPDWQWRLATSHRLFQVNRWRASDFSEAFGKYGLEISLEVTATVDVDPAYRSSFASRFRGKALDDLATVGIFVVARKLTESRADSAVAPGSRRSTPVQAVGTGSGRHLPWRAALTTFSTATRSGSGTEPLPV